LGQQAASGPWNRERNGGTRYRFFEQQAKQEAYVPESVANFFVFHDLSLA
jgi:hypothetical protein